VEPPAIPFFTWHARQKVSLLWQELHDVSRAYAVLACPAAKLNGW